MAGADPDHEEHVQASKRHCAFDAEEIAARGSSAAAPLAQHQRGPASFDAAERASSAIHPVRRMKIRVKHPYGHEPATLPGQRLSRQEYQQVSSLCPGLEPCVLAASSLGFVTSKVAPMTELLK